MNNNSLSSFLKKPVWLASLLLPIVLILAACQPAATPQPTAAPSPAPTTIAAPTATTAASSMGSEPTITVVTDPKLGKILVDAKGMTLYMFTKDTPDTSNCSGGCLQAWPPLLSQGSPKASDGVDQSMLSTATMADGSKIVTYNHMPL